MAATVSGGATLPPKAAAPPRLAAIMTLADPAGLRPEALHLQGIDLSRLPLLDDPGVQSRLATLLGAPLSAATMQEVRQIILERYRAQGRPFVDVGFPPQDITDGVLQVVVTEFRIGAVRVEGTAWFSDAVIRTGAGLQPGAPVDKTALEGRLEQLNAGPFLQVTPAFRPGTAPGTTDVVLHAQDHMPVRVSVGYDNTGSPVTGWDRWQLGVTWGNAFWSGQTLGYQFTSSTDFWHHRPVIDGKEVEPAVAGHSVNWQVPLPWGHALLLSGSYMRQVPQLGPDLGSIGVTVQAGLQYVLPLGAVRLGSLTGSHELALGYDFKRSNNQLSFGGSSVSQGFTAVSQFSLRYGLSMPDGWGQTMLQNTLVLSPGNMMPDNTDAAFQPNDAGTQSGTLGARARYIYNRASLTRLVPLPANFGALLRVTGQLADATLLPSEQLSIAGVESVRGYQDSSITGSAGVVFSTELRGPAFSPGHLLFGRETGDIAQLHVFWDYGQGWNRDPTSSVPANLHTASLGVGGHYDIGRTFSLRVEQGWQLIRQPSQAAGGAFAHVAVTASW